MVAIQLKGAEAVPTAVKVDVVTDVKPRAFAKPVP
jgi:hypothetical protein